MPFALVVLELLGVDVASLAPGHTSWRTAPSCRSLRSSQGAKATRQVLTEEEEIVAEEAEEEEAEVGAAMAEEEEEAVDEVELW